MYVGHVLTVARRVSTNSKRMTGLFFGHFFAKSTQLELAVFEFFQDFARVLSFFTKNTPSFLATVFDQWRIYYLMSKKDKIMDSH